MPSTEHDRSALYGADPQTGGKVKAGLGNSYDYLLSKVFRHNPASSEVVR